MTGRVSEYELYVMTVGPSLTCPVVGLAVSIDSVALFVPAIGVLTASTVWPYSRGSPQLPVCRGPSASDTGLTVAATHVGVLLPAVADVCPLSSKPLPVTAICVKSADDGSGTPGGFGAATGGGAAFGNPGLVAAWWPAWPPPPVLLAAIPTPTPATTTASPRPTRSVSPLSLLVRRRCRTRGDMDGTTADPRLPDHRHVGLDPRHQGDAAGGCVRLLVTDDRLAHRLHVGDHVLEECGAVRRGHHHVVAQGGGARRHCSRRTSPDAI